MRGSELVTAGALLLCACSGYATQPDPIGSAVAVQGVRVTPQVLQLSAIGERKQLVATIVPENATDRVITWESIDPSVASVDDKGVVTARAPGLAVFVTAHTHDGDFQSSANVAVIP